MPTVFADDFFISIPFGAYTPTLDTPVENWYEPPAISISVGDTVHWKNNDREGHTVTSGEGSGRFGWMGDDFGTPDEIFDSGRFMLDESWSHAFDDPGIFPYFCSIHPWMEGFVIVQNELPDIPIDSEGKKIEIFPVVRYTGDGIVEVNLSWEPHIITTNTKTQLIYQFYDPSTNSNLQKMDYDFIITQNGKEIFRDHGKNQIGGDYRNFIFEDIGPVTFRYENIVNKNFLVDESTSISQQVMGNNEIRSVEFTTVVYENPVPVDIEQIVIQPAQRLEFQYELALAIILIPGGLTLFVIYKQMRYKTKPKKRTAT